MINENVLGRRFRFRRSCGGHRISPLASQYQCPRPSLSIITSRLAYTTGTRRRLRTLAGISPTSTGTDATTLSEPAHDILFRHTMQNQSVCPNRSKKGPFAGHEAPYDCLEHSDLLKVPRGRPHWLRQRTVTHHEDGTNHICRATAPTCARSEGACNGRGLVRIRRPVP